MSTAKQRLITLQKRIHKMLDADTDRLLGKTPAAIQRYQREYNRDFTTACKKTTPATRKSVLIQAIRKSTVTIVGDYHTYPQAQRTFLRILRDAIKPGEHWFIGLEMIPSHRQGVLDEFQAGRISLEDFHRQIAYSDTWGFPWKNYEPIFEWARKHRVRLVALNRPDEISRHSSASMRRMSTDRDLAERDQWAAGIITDFYAAAVAEKKPKPRFLILYGELHVSKSHLPKQIEAVSKNYLSKALTALSIYQNHDDLYWKLARKSQNHGDQIIKIHSTGYCIQSGTPWAKLQSLVSWAEGDSPAFAITKSDDDESSGIDHLTALQIYGQILCELLDIPTPEYESLTLLTAQEADFIERLDHEKVFSKREVKTIKTLVLNNQRVYLPELHLAYLGSPSLNGTAELTAIYLFRERTKNFEIDGGTRDDFFRWIMESCFGFFGSLVINPKRKCDLQMDHLRKVRQIPKTPWEKSDKRAREICLKFIHKNESPLGLDSLPAGPLAELLGARYIGELLGLGIHYSLIQGKITPEEIRHICLSRAEGEFRPFESRVHSALRIFGAIRGKLNLSKTEFF